MRRSRGRTWDFRSWNPWTAVHGFGLFAHSDSGHVPRSEQTLTQPTLLIWHEIQIWFFCATQEHRILHFCTKRWPRLRSLWTTNPNMPFFTSRVISTPHTYTHTHTQWRTKVIILYSSFQHEGWCYRAAATLTRILNPRRSLMTPETAERITTRVML